MTNEQLRKTLVLMSLLDEEKGRRFLVSDKIREEYVMSYKKTNEYDALYSFSTEFYGMTSDCYVLYAICSLGVADVKTICNFLVSLSVKYPELRISCSTVDVLHERLRALHRVGMVCKVTYDTGDTDVGIVSLYLAAPYAMELARQSLNLTLPINKGIEFKKIDELVGWACGAMVGVRIANNACFVDYMHRYLRTKQLGPFYFPCEVLVAENGTSYYISVMSSFLRNDSELYTPRMYAEICAHKVNMIKNYLRCRTQTGIAIVVVAVRDNTDLNELTSYIHGSGSMTDLYSNIYFTGEGILNCEGVGFEDAFLQMYLSSDNEQGYGLCCAKPVFV